MSALLQRLYESRQRAYFGGTLPADAVVQDVRLPLFRLGDCFHEQD